MKIPITDEIADCVLSEYFENYDKVTDYHRGVALEMREYMRKALVSAMPLILDEISKIAEEDNSIIYFDNEEGVHVTGALIYPRWVKELRDG